MPQHVRGASVLIIPTQNNLLRLDKAVAQLRSAGPKPVGPAPVLNGQHTKDSTQYTAWQRKYAAWQHERDQRNKEIEAHRQRTVALLGVGTPTRTSVAAYIFGLGLDAYAATAATTIVKG